MSGDWLVELERLAEAGYRPNTKAETNCGTEVTIISFPFTDGQSVGVLARTTPDDPSSWKEFDVRDLVVRRDTTPVT